MPNLCYLDPMERWTDQGIVIGVRGHGEGGAVATLLTANHGKHAGYVHGGATSQRLRASLQPGTLVDIEWSAQSMDQLGTVAVQDSQNLNTAWLNDPAALAALQSVCVFLDRTVPEREPHAGLYEGTKVFLDLLGHDREIWGGAYVLWELSLLRGRAFGLQMHKCAVPADTENLTYVSPKTGKAVSEAGAGTYKDRLLTLPGFLGGGDHDGNEDVLAGLKLSGYFIEHRLFAHTTHTMPEARLRLPSFFEPQ